MKKIILLYIMYVMALGAMAQSDRNFIRSGNRYFRQQNYAQAEVDYRKALAKNGSNAQALYNLGCALSAQQKDSTAMVQYMKAAKLEKAKIRKAMIYHNMGVIFQKSQQYDRAADAYAESLRNNPKDNETRYNYILCKRKQSNHTKNRNKNKNKNKKQKDKKEQNKKDKNKDKNQQNQNQQQKMSKENAEQLLNAAMQEEKATQQHLKKAMQQPRSKNLQKNW